MQSVIKRLNQSQIEKLSAFITDQKFGKLIEEAINTWKVYNVTFGDFGIDWNNSSKKYKIRKNNCCCLVGASIIGKENGVEEEMYTVITRLYNLSNNEVHNLWRGFDNVKAGMSLEILESDAYQFGLKIRKIVLDED